MRLDSILLGDRHMRAYGWTVVDDDAVRAILAPAGRGQVVNLIPIDRRLADDALAFPSPAAAMIWISSRLASRVKPHREPLVDKGNLSTWEREYSHDR